MVILSIFISATWIDAVDLGKNGVWMWFSSGKSVTHLPWDNGQPSKYKSSENCALTFHLGRAKWHDAFCTSTITLCARKRLIGEIFILYFMLINLHRWIKTRHICTFLYASFWICINNDS